MREIRFRAWCKLDKILYDWEQVKKEFTLEYFDDKGLIFQQYTGLKDKNGVEIYEGDVIKTIKGNVQVVEFLTAYNSTDNKTMVSQFSLKGDKGYYFFDVTDEVIGNIYENPELLETKKSS